MRTISPLLMINSARGFYALFPTGRYDRSFGCLGGDKLSGTHFAGRFALLGQLAFGQRPGANLYRERALRVCRRLRRCRRRAGIDFQTGAECFDRASAGVGENVMVGGFIVSGDRIKRVVLRALGPSLGQDGVNGVWPILT